MKKIKYEFYQSTTKDGVDITLPKVLPWNEVNEEIAKIEAYNGEYEIYDDGQPEPVVEPSQLDVIEAQVTYTAMMTDTLLEV